MSHGIVVPGRDKDMEASNLWYDSRRTRLQIALDRDPPHLQLLKTGGGTALSCGLAPTVVTETLFTMEHHLPYKPRVLVYFFADPVANAGYGVGRLFYDVGGAIEDSVGYVVTDTTFSIVHTLTSYGGLAYTSTAPSKKLQIKYMIFSIPVNKKVSDV